MEMELNRFSNFFCLYLLFKLPGSQEYGQVCKCCCAPHSGGCSGFANLCGRESL